MAFLQHQRHPAPRQLPSSTSADVVEATSSQSIQRKRPLEDSEEWVLFSPHHAPSTVRSFGVSTERTAHSANLSRLSDFGSIDTEARSGIPGQSDRDIQVSQGAGFEEDGEEVDSLDEGLRAFHEQSDINGHMQHLGQSETVLPTHDGLGKFPASYSLLEDRIRVFEGRKASLQTDQGAQLQQRLDTLNKLDYIGENDRTQRIEKWRMDQSRALLEEIEKETRRRRRMSGIDTTARRASASTSASQLRGKQSRAAFTPSEPLSRAARNEGPENLSFWQRFTQRVMRDLIGLDENLLEVIFGEALPESANHRETGNGDGSNALDSIAHEVGMVEDQHNPWEHQILQRIARELGILVHHLSEHPGAFSAYLQPKDTYQRTDASSAPPNRSRTQSIVAPEQLSRQKSSQIHTPAFNPTLDMLDQTHSGSCDPSLWGIEEEVEPSTQASGADEATRLEQDCEYWERGLDAKMVFRFLLKRFSSRPPSPEASMPPHNPGASTRRRAAMIRQQHPLVSNFTSSHTPSPASTRRKDVLHRQHLQHSHQSQPTAANITNLMLASRRARSSSCASQSTRKSKSRRSGSNASFWEVDMPGSVGSGGPVSGVGAWGEA